MIEVRGPNVFKGYWRMPDKTAAEFREDGFFVTGDLGKIDARGYVHIAGRGKDLVISGGYNVYPEGGRKRDRRDRRRRRKRRDRRSPPRFRRRRGRGCGKDQGGAYRADILEPLKKRLANYKLPKRVVFVESLPRNTMGKVQKNLLREISRSILEIRPGYDRSKLASLTLSLSPWERGRPE